MHWKMDGRPGVYKITNLKTGNTYIGSTKNLYRRWKRHQQVLRRGLKENIRMHEDCSVNGVDSFCVGVIEYCNEENLRDREQHYFEQMSPTYNVWKHVYDATDREYTKKQLKEFKEVHRPIRDKEKFRLNLREAWKRRKANCSPEELTEKMSQARKGIPHSEETKKKYSETRKGKPKSEEWKEKMRKARQGTKLVNGTWIRVI